MSFESINKGEFLDGINLKELLRGIPHIIFNDSGAIISRDTPDLVSSLPKIEIWTSNPSQGVLISAQVQDEFLKPLEAFLSHCWSSTYDFQINKALSETVEILGNDFTRFYSGDLFKDRTSLSVQVKKAFFLLKSHVPVQEFAVFFIDKKNGLKEFARIGGKEDIHRFLPMDGSNLESIAALSKSIYYAPNCKEEASFRNQPNIYYTNYLCLPLFQDGIVVGVLSIIDYLEKEWSQEDLKKAKLFSKLLIWIKMNKEGNEIFHEEIIEEKIYLNYLTKKYSKKVKDEPPTEREVHCMVVNIRGSKEIFKGVEEKVLKELYEKYGKIIFDVCGKYEAEIDDFFGDTISK